MVRIWCKVAVAAALPLGALAVTSGIAGAVASVDATQYTASCTTFTGGLHFKPHLVNDPTPVTATVKAALSGCTAEPDNSGTAVDLVTGKITGTLTINVGSSSDCAMWFGGSYATTGSLTISWKTAKGSPKLSSGNTVVTPGGLTTGLTGQGGSVTLQIPDSPGDINNTGSFSGSDAGASDSFSFDGEAGSTVFRQCYNENTGMHKLLYENASPFALG